MSLLFRHWLIVILYEKVAIEIVLILTLLLSRHWDLRSLVDVEDLRFVKFLASVLL